MPEEITDGSVVKITSNNILTGASIANLAISNGAEVSDVSTEDEVCYNVEIKKLMPETSYVLSGTLSDLAGNSESLSKEFTTAARKTDISFIYNEKEIDKLCAGDIVVGVKPNGKTAEWNGISLAAIYDNSGKLKDVKIIEHPDDNVKSVVLSAEENDSISVYRWEDMVNIEPIAQNISFDKEGIK